MASLHYCASAPHSIGALRRPSAVNRASSFRFTLAFYSPQDHLRFRLKQEVRLQIKQKWSPPVVLASNSNPAGESDDDAKTNDNTAAQGPPFLTVLAGFIVLLLIFWIIGSIVMWLIGLIVHPPP